MQSDDKAAQDSTDGVNAPVPDEAEVAADPVVLAEAPPAPPLPAPELLEHPISARETRI
jgi:hypothetical protein